jgi:hypothetical protein
MGHIRTGQLQKYGIRSGRTGRQQPAASSQQPAASSQQLAAAAEKQQRAARAARLLPEKQNRLRGRGGGWVGLLKNEKRLGVVRPLAAPPPALLSARRTCFHGGGGVQAPPRGQGALHRRRDYNCHGLVTSPECNHHAPQSSCSWQGL